MKNENYTEKPINYIIGIILTCLVVGSLSLILDINPFSIWGIFLDAFVWNEMFSFFVWLLKMITSFSILISPFVILFLTIKGFNAYYKKK